ncbi:cysteine-rich KTR domain-containing protein [Intestinimonas massiliensis (ex Afouda et al. 2020)]
MSETPQKSAWIFCPICGKKTRTKVYEDTTLPCPFGPDGFSASTPESSVSVDDCSTRSVDCGLSTIPEETLDGESSG